METRTVENEKNNKHIWIRISKRCRDTKGKYRVTSVIVKGANGKRRNRNTDY
jgi:DNA/RNA endonuclease G (NUC1)